MKTITLNTNMWKPELASHVELKTMEDWEKEYPADWMKRVSTYCSGCGSTQKEIGVVVCENCSK